MMTCSPGDYFPQCAFPKLCDGTGCVDCRSGHHICARDRGYYSRTCWSGTKCHYSGCVSGEDPDNPYACPQADADPPPACPPPPPPLPPPPLPSTCTMYGETYYNMGVMNIPYGNDAAGKFNNAKWYQAICNAAGLVPTGCARSDPPYSNAKLYGAGEAYACNPSGSLVRDCGWQYPITFHAPPKDSSDSTENIDDYGLCGRSCTISNTTGWSPICMTAGNYYVNTYNWIGTGRTGWTGGYGGSCTCPDGQVYQVGDDNNSCNSMSKGCVGGTATSCYKSSGKWSYGKVTCATHTPLLG